MTYLQSVVAALEAVVQLAGGIGPDQLAHDHVRLRAIERYWVLAGNAAKAHAHAQGLAAGTEPWSGLAGVRDALAHHRVDEVQPVLLHTASTIEAPQILARLALP